MAVSGSNKIQIEPSDPLFLHPSDHPGQALVADVFNGEDFEKWKRSVMIALSAKQKIAFIDGSYGKPDANSPLLPYWQRCNDMVLSWLLNSLHKTIRDSVLFCEKASDMWKELMERYGQANKARLFQAQKEVVSISQGTSDIASYFNKARKVWDELDAVGSIPRCTCKKCECEVNSRLQNYDQEQKLIQFLMGLNESYTSVRGNILMMSPLPTLSQTYSLLIEEERQRQVKSGDQFNTESASFIASTHNNHKPFVGKKFEWRRSHLFCDHCKKTGHTIDKCYKIHGYPSKSGGRNRPFKGANAAWGEQEGQAESSAITPQLPGLNQEQSQQLFQFLSNLTASKDSRPQVMEASASVAHMAGPFSEEATGHW